MPSTDDITNQLELLAAHRQTLAAYLRREALQGEAHADPEVINGIRAARVAILRCKAMLRGWGQAVEDLPDDIEPINSSTRLPFVRRPLVIGIGTVIVIAVVVAVVLLRGPSNVINGSNNLLNTGTIGQLTINAGDSSEVRQQKVLQAKRLIVQDTIANIGSIDARLNYVAVALKPVHDLLQLARQTVAPASELAAKNGYRQLIATEQVSALRQSLNGRPLRLEFGAPLVQVLVDSGADASSVRGFYDELAATNDATESLLATLDSAARDAGDEGKYADWVKKIELARDTLRNRSQTAYLFGQLALHAMDATPADADALTLLRELEPHGLITPEQVGPLYQAVMQEAQELIRRRQALIVEEQAQVATAVGNYQQLSDQLVIQPTDTQEQVVKKARSLRDLGRIDEAVAAFVRYGEMFGADPSTAQYTEVAQAFTRQMNGLGLTGGAYVFGVADGSTAQSAGIAIGDILTAYNGQAIVDADQATQTIKSTPEGIDVSVEWLHLEASGRLTRQQARVPSGKLGVAMMLI